MMKAIRIVAGLGIIAALLWIANLTVLDCEVSLLVYENCAWLDVRDALGLSQSKLLRAGLLQLVGLFLLGGMVLAWKYIMPPRERKPGSPRLMDETSNAPGALQMERRLLRLLVQDPAAREILAGLLRRYPWHDMAHRVIFEITLQAPQLTANQLRDVLPARLANGGVPDFPWEELHRSEALSLPEAEAFLLMFPACREP